MPLSFLGCFLFLLGRVFRAARPFDSRQIATAVSIAVVERIRGWMFLREQKQEPNRIVGTDTAAFARH